MENSVCEEKIKVSEGSSSKRWTGREMNYSGAKDAMPKAPACQSPYVNVFKHFCVDEWKLASRCVESSISVVSYDPVFGWCGEGTEALDFHSQSEVPKKHNVCFPLMVDESLAIFMYQLLYLDLLACFWSVREHCINSNKTFWSPPATRTTLV